MGNPKHDFSGKGAAELNYFLGLGNESAGFASQGKRRDPPKAFGTLKLPHSEAPAAREQIKPAGQLAYAQHGLYRKPGGGLNETGKLLPTINTKKPLVAARDPAGPREPVRLLLAASRQAEPERRAVGRAEKVLRVQHHVAGAREVRLLARAQERPVTTFEC